MREYFACHTCVKPCKEHNGDMLCRHQRTWHILGEEALLTCIH